MVALHFILAIVSGFLLAGSSGAVCFGLFTTLAIRSRFSIQKSPVRFILVFLVLSSVGYILMMVFGLVGSSKRVHQRVDAIRTQLEQQGHSPRWVIISQKRHPLFNEYLLNSVDKSKHLKGEAIDIYVMDIDGDWDYDRTDFKLVEDASAKVGKTEPSLKGKVFHYFHAGFFSRRMIHVE